MLEQDSNPWTLLYTGVVSCMHAVHTVHTLFYVGFSSQAECFHFSADFSLQYSYIILEL